MKEAHFRVRLILIISLVVAQSWMFAGGLVSRARNMVVDVAVDSSGNVFIADEMPSQIRKLTPTGTLTVIAGNSGVPGFSGDGGPATSANLSRPQGVAVDAGGNVYIADTGNFRIRKIDRSGMITTIAGNGTRGGTVEGSPATASGLTYPLSLAVDGTGNVFIGDTGCNCIRKISNTGILTTVAKGAGFVSERPGAAAAAPFNAIWDVAIDAAGNLFVPDRDRARRISPSGMAVTIAGIGTAQRAASIGFSGDGSSATSAQISNPKGIAVDGSGNLFIADTGNQRIRKVSQTGIITTVAGSGSNGFSGDGGPAIAANLSQPVSVAVDRSGNLYIADNGNNRVRKVNTAGVICTIATSAASGERGGMPPGPSC